MVGVADRGCIADPEERGQVQRIRPVGEGFLEVAVHSEPVEREQRFGVQRAGPVGGFLPAGSAVALGDRDVPAAATGAVAGRGLRFQAAQAPQTQR